MNSPLLEKISQPSDLKKLSSQQTVQLCAEIREFLLDNVCAVNTESAVAA